MALSFLPEFKWGEKSQETLIYNTPPFGKERNPNVSKRDGADRTETKGLASHVDDR